MVAVWQRCLLLLLPSFFFGISEQASCGTSSDADPNDFSSSSAMTAGGWSCANCNAANMIYHWSPSNGDCATTAADTFCGYSQDSGSLFELRMDLVGGGVLHLDFSSLHADSTRETKVYLNGAWQGECDMGERKTLDIEFEDGDQLGIRQAHISVVMNVHSITFSDCDETTTQTTTSATTSSSTFSFTSSTSRTVTDTSTSITLTSSSSSTSSTSSWTTSSTSFTSSSSSSTTSSSRSGTWSTTSSTTRSATSTSTWTTTNTISSSTASSTTRSATSTSTWTTTNTISSSTISSTTITSSTSSTTTSTGTSTSSSSKSTSWTSTTTRSMTSNSTITNSTTSTSTTFTTTSISFSSTSTQSETSSATSGTSTLSTSRTSISTTSSTSSQADVVLALNVAESSVVQDFLGTLDISSLELEGEGVLTSQYVDIPMGETFVAVVSGASEAVTSAGSVRLDAELMQQLGGQPLVLSFTSLSDAAAEQFGAELAVPVSISLWSLQGSRISVSNAVVPLQIRIPTNNSEAQCVFWNETSEEWTSDGLTRVGYEEGVLICESTHLTIFSVFWQQFAIALRCSTAPALLSAEGLSAFGQFPSWLGYSSSLIVILSLFFFGLCMGSAVGSDRLAEQKGKDELAFVVKSPAPASKCCAPVLRVSAMLGMDDTLRDLLALRDRKAVYEAFVSRCIRMLHSHKAGACWDSLRLVMLESSASHALMKSQSLLHRTKRKFNKAFSLVLGRSQKVQPMVEKEEWHESGGVRIVEGFLFGSWSSRVCSLAPAVHPWLKAVQSSLFSSHSSRTMLMYLKLVTAGAVNALFYQGSALSTKTESEECREPETPFLQAMRAFAIGIFSALVGDLLILILWKVQKRPSVISEPWSEEVEERTLRRWKLRLRGFWCVSLGHCFFCLFYIFAFLANVTHEDSSKWLVATLVSLVEDLLMLPVTLAVSFGSVATLLLFFRPDVKADIRARWIDEDTGTISQIVVFKPSKKSVYILENEDLEAAPYTTPPPLSENIRVESVGPSASQGNFFGVSPTRQDGCEAKAVAADDDVLT